MFLTKNIAEGKWKFATVLTWPETSRSLPPVTTILRGLFELRALLLGLPTR